jgi:hypothetical protein
MHLYLATDLTDAPSLADPDEQIDRSWMTITDAVAATDDGRIVDAKSLAGIGWLARRLGG